MCGIAGIIAADSGEVSLSRLKKMSNIIAHRGPDGEGHWISSNGKVGLAHRRLSIIDLSEDANQPMHYLGRYTIVFNGEIYNYVELKSNLKKAGYSFRTSSDTEVILALYDQEKENCMQYFDGMFSFVIYDQLENTVFCARDRFGEKPFFFNYEKGRSFVFGSEMKALWVAGIDKKINNRMLYNYLTFSVLEDNDPQITFYEGCFRLPPAHYLKFNVSDLAIEIKRYYDIDYKSQDNNISESDAAEKFRELFITSVKRRLRSDVPVGSSLSGGLDSSAVVMVIDDLLKGSTQIQKTFSAVFPGFAKDESRFIKKVVEATNVDPHYITPTDKDMVENLDKLIFHQEEPFGSASIFVQYSVMKLAKENGVTVLLDGQGADEILAGYHFYYKHFHNELKTKKSKKATTEISLHKKLRAENNRTHQFNQGFVGKLESVSPGLVAVLRRAYHLSQPSNKKNLYTPDFLEQGNGIGLKPMQNFSSLNESLYFSTAKRGLHELLRYADRNSMAHSREVRLPFLSADLVDFVFSLPAEFKINNAWTKWVLRSAFTGLLPGEICWRKDKIGYEPPQKTWMENPLFIQKVRASQERLVKEGILKKEVLDQKIMAGGVGQTINSSWSHFAAGNLFF